MTYRFVLSSEPTNLTVLRFEQNGWKTHEKIYHTWNGDFTAYLHNNHRKKLENGNKSHERSADTHTILIGLGPGPKKAKDFFLAAVARWETVIGAPYASCSCVLQRLQLERSLRVWKPHQYAAVLLQLSLGQPYLVIIMHFTQPKVKFKALFWKDIEEPWSFLRVY